MAERSGLRPSALAGEALAGLVQRPGRSLLTALGTVLGTGALVAVLGLTTTADAQISQQFNVLMATTVTVQDTGGQSADTGADQGVLDFPPDAEARADRLHGVVHAGVYWQLPLRNPVVSALPATAAGSALNVGSGISVYAASSGLLAAAQPTVRTGELYNAYQDTSSAHVAVLGPAAASALGITQLSGSPAVFIDNVPFTVVGIMSNAQRVPELLLGIAIPRSAALDLFGPPSPDNPATMIVQVRLGAANQVAREIPLALRPDDPSAFTPVPPPNPQQLRHNVTSDLASLFVLLALVSLAIGGVSIANTTLVAVLERTSEIGLRRALGARPRHITAQFLTESAALGLLGGLIGTSVGVAVVVATAVAKHWTAVLDPATVIPAPLAGSLVGLLAGAYPAIRAARIQPAEALRR